MTGHLINFNDWLDNNIRLIILILIFFLIFFFYIKKIIIIQLLGYRLGNGLIKDDISEILLDDTQIKHRLIEELQRGLEYEFRIAGRNKIGYEQEAVRLLPTSSGNILEL